MIRSPFFVLLLGMLSLFLLAGCGGGSGSDAPPQPPVVFYAITSDVNPEDGGTVLGTGNYRSGTSFTLTAVPAPGFVFFQWVEGGVKRSSTGSVELFGTASEDRDITAEFLPATLELSPGDLTLIAGAPATLSAKLVVDDEDPVDVSSAASWFSGNDEVATVDGQGTVIAVAEGTVSISAEFGGQVATTSVRVLPDEISSLTFEPAAVTLAIGESYTPTLIAHYASGESASVALDRADLSSSSPAIVEVTEGNELIAKISGDASITARIDEVEAILSVTVPDALLQNIEIESPVAEGGPVFVGAQLNFIARGVYSDDENRDLTDRVTWTSSNPDVLTIESGGANAGRATAVGIGDTLLSASFQEITGPSVSLQVVLDEAVPVSVSLPVSDDVVRWPGAGEAPNKTLQAEVVNGFGGPPTDEQSLVFSIVSGPLTFAGGGTEQTVTTDNGQASVVVTATGPGQALVRVRVAGTSLVAQSRLFVIETIDQVLIGSRTESMVEVDGVERLRVRFTLLNQSQLSVPVKMLRIRVPGNVDRELTDPGGPGPNFLPFSSVPGRGIVSQGILFDPGTEGIEATYTVEDPQTGQQFDIEL